MRITNAKVLFYQNSFPACYYIEKQVKKLDLF